MTKAKAHHHEVEDCCPNKMAVLDLARLADCEIVSDDGEVTLPSVQASVEKTAITLWELRRKTSPFSKKYVPGCQASLLRTEAKRGRWLFRVKCSKPDSKPEGHIVRVRVLKGKGRKMITRDVQVSCSCPAWLYWGAEYNAAHDGYLERKSPNPGINKDKGINDPGRTYKICKHVYTVGFVVREWAVPYEFEGEVQYRFKERKVEPEAPPVEPEAEVPELLEMEEIEPGVPEVPRRAPLKEPPLKETLPPPPPEPEEVAPPEEVPPEEPTPGEEEEEEDFPVYLL